MQRNTCYAAQPVQGKYPGTALKSLLEMEIKHRDEAWKIKYTEQSGFYAAKSPDGFIFDEIRFPSGTRPSDFMNSPVCY